MTKHTNSAPIKALPTYYKGHTFRSRLEARWAIVFDHLNIPWEYEKEAYALPSGNYLPDFWLPTIREGMWFEVKGQEPTDHEEKLAWELANATEHDVAIAFGQVPEDSYSTNSSAYMYFAPTEHHGGEMITDGWDNHYAFTHCPMCNKAGFEFLGYGQRVCAHGGDFKTFSPQADLAYAAGRTARFNNGHHAK